MNDNNNDYIIDEKLSFILFVIFYKARDKKKIFNVNKRRLHFKSIDNKS